MQAWKQLSRLQRQHSLPFPGPVSILAPAAADTDAESDQVPSTPQQQWQRKMLPPLWSVDQKGKPIYKEDLRQHLEQQQQQQQQWLAQVHHAVAQQGAVEGPFATSHELLSVPPSELQHGPAAQVAGGAAGAVEPGTPAQSATDSSAADTQPWPAGSQHAAPVPIDSAAADKAAAAASAAAAAAQQASVDKLIALLQPQPLMHAISLPPGQKDQQAAATAANTDTAATGRPLRSVSGVPAANGQNSQHGQQQQQQLQPEQPQQSKTAPLPQIVAHGPSDLIPATLSGAAAAAGLPPRAPAAHHGPHILPPAQLAIPAAGFEGQGPEPRHTASISAPTSPSVGPRSGASSAGGFHRVSAAAGAAAAAGGGGPGGAGVPAWSPRQLASAAAAAGPLSPRALPASSAGGAGAVGGVGVMGLQQQQQQLQARQASTPLGSPVSSVLDAPEVQIQHSHLFNYYLVEIHCRDRNKLLFDTVCEYHDGGSWGLCVVECYSV